RHVRLAPCAPRAPRAPRASRAPPAPRAPEHPPPMYVELNAASAISFLDGASLPEALVERTAELGYPALALLDRDGVYSAPRFHLAATRAGIKALIGAELTMGIGTADSVFRLPVLVESREGYRNLCRLITRMKLRS